MKLIEMLKFIGSKTALLNANGDFVDGIVSKEDLIRFINYRRLYLFLKFADSFPETYTVTTTVDTVNGQSEYTFGGDTLGDKLEIRYMGIKFSSTDIKYTRVFRDDYRNLFYVDTDVTRFSKKAPKYYDTAYKDTTDPRKQLYNSFGIVPIPDADIEEGIMIKYVEIPKDLSDDDDVAWEMPNNAHYLICDYAIADVWEAKGDDNKADRALNRAYQNDNNFFSNYQPVASDEPAISNLSRNFNVRIRRR